MPLVLSGSTGIVSANIADGTIAAGDLASGAARTNFGAGAVLSVYQAAFTNIMSVISNGTWSDVTDLSITLTPSSSSSKFLLQASIVYGATINAAPALRFTGGNSSNFIGDSRGSRRRVVFCGGNDYFNGDSSATNNAFNAQIMYIDSPNTTSTITYKVQAMTDGNGTMYINKDPEDPDSSGEGWTGASSFVIMEIAA